MNLTRKILFLTLCVFFSLVTQAQENMIFIYGNLKIEDGSRKGAEVVVYKNGSKVQTIDASRKFEFELRLDQNYIIEFRKDGYITKKISFNTNAPEDRKQYDFQPQGFTITLLPQFDEVNTVIFNQPVGKYAYDPEMEDFYYDTDYTQSIQSALADVEEQIKEKQEEVKEQKEQEEVKKLQKLQKQQQRLAKKKQRKQRRRRRQRRRQLKKQRKRLLRKRQKLRKQPEKLQKRPLRMKQSE